MIEKSIRHNPRTVLSEIIGDHHRRGIARLPTLKELSGCCRVSHVTIRKIIGEYVSRGELTVRQGRWIEITALSNAPSQGRFTIEKSWRRVKDLIAGEIITGAFPSATALPSAKELCHRYGASFRSLGTALDACVSGGLLVYRSRRYVVDRPRPLSAGSILLILRDVTSSIRLTEMVRALQAECIQFRIRLEILGCGHVSGGQAGRILEPVLRDKKTAYLGFIVLPAGMSDDSVGVICNRLSGVEKPVAFLDETGGYGNAGFLRGQRMRRFSMSNNRSPGEIMGRYLLAKNHRHVAYITANLNTVWSVNRYEGVCDAFANSGLAGAVHRFGMDFPFFEMSSVYVRQSQELQKQMTGLADPPLRPVLNSKRKNEPDLFDFLLSKTSMLHAQTALRPHLESALLNPQITAWVAENDDVAMDCLAFLAEKGKQVPTHIAVAAFDNSITSVGASLTSFDFNMLSYVRAMVMHVIDPLHIRKFFPGPGGMEIEGFVVERGSTRSGG